jgi:aspartokinase
MGDSRGQHINDIITSAQGEWKRNPEVGCNISIYIKSICNPASVGNIITQQLKGDKFATSGITVTSTLTTLKVKGKTAR